ncbi:MAG: hypothetical protein PWP54_57 [Thermosipho sp. (in: thermotogales)]|nr:hypothetical protein [Thermosipho sp. (in: thermotogales)]MDN5324347.1 hypothetical protein [Thermosipho sp. (in: thermotogales)]
MKLFKKSDFLIIFFVLLVLLIFFTVKTTGNEKGNFVVKLDGKEILELKDPGEYEIKNENGELLTIVHFDGEYAWVTNSSCPLKICEKTGKISKGGEIICVPNKIVIESKNTQELQTW